MSTVAETILAQLGGRQFIMMTGAKDMCAGKDSLHMTLGRGTKNKATKMVIKLDANDTYTMSFYKIRKYELILIEEIEGVYCDQLTEIFTDRTGFFTKL